MSKGTTEITPLLRRMCAAAKKHADALSEGPPALPNDHRPEWMLYTGHSTRLDSWHAAIGFVLADARRELAAVNENTAAIMGRAFFVEHQDEIE